MTEPAALGPMVLEHFRRPRNHRRLEGASATGNASNASCGDRVEIAIRVDDGGRVCDAAFQGEACSVAVAAASVVTELVRGLPVAEAALVSGERVRESLGAVPPGRERCASLASVALADALAKLPRGNEHLRGVAGLVLAAGSSTRFGGSKLTALLDGQPVVRRTVSALIDAGLAPVAVVIGGPHAAAVRSALVGLPVEFIERQGDGGIGDSLAAGARALALDLAIDAIVVALGDQPGIQRRAVSELVRATREHARQIAVPVYRGERGHPVVFRRETFADLARCTGDVGAAGLIASSGDAVAKVQFDCPSPEDIDTPDALARMQREFGVGSRSSATVVRQVR